MYSRAFMMMAALAPYGMGWRLPRPPAPEKYQGQRQAFRKGAWTGDGTPSGLRVKPRKPRTR